MAPSDPIEELRESLELSQGTAKAIAETLGHLTRSDRRKTWLLRGCGLALVLVFGGLWQIHSTAVEAEAAARDAKATLAQVQADRLAAREARCHQDDKDNADHRRAIVDGNLTASTASGEALIKTITEAGRPADPKLVDAYRANLQGIRPDLEGIANTFPSYRWDPKTETCIEVPMDTGG